ncbi:hypothetical protein ONZ45_g13171 [Pleurotus djamor]|nr:hypothetical protein ONZ45_g13171 [Pleurotus djamor]
MSSTQPTIPSLRTREDANPPRLPKPSAEDTKPDIHTALFDCPKHPPPRKLRKVRHLIVNIDGTSNQFSVNSTNVVELFSRIIKIDGDIEQLVYYNSGIGTYARPSFRSWNYWKQVVYNLIDTAIAWNFERIVHAAYKWLSENYEPGDRIFLFGELFESAYELYTATTAHSKRASTKTDGDATRGPTSTPEGNNKRPTFSSEEDELCWSFKKSLCHKDVKVHFVGAWDTVSSIGVFRGKSLPETVSGMGHVCHFRHALALDERRAKFQPEYVNGGLGPIEGETKADIKEVWFKGTHSDIGGGNVRNKYLENFSDSLRWMTYEAQFCGLLIEPYTGNWVPVTPKESLTGVWMLLEIIPFGALSYKDKDSLTWRPHLGKPRKIQSGQLIHQSVFATPAKHKSLPLGTTEVTARAESHTAPSDEDRASPPETSTSRGVSTVFFGYIKRLRGARAENLIPERRMSREGDLERNGASAEMPDAMPKYRPKAVLHSSLEISEWSTLFSEYSQGEYLPIIEQDPFENASHVLSTLSQACDVLESGQGDRGSALSTLTVGIQTLQSFLDDPTRLSSLREVPDAAEILLKTITTAVRDNTITPSPESKKTLVRLFARAWAPWKHISTTTVPRPLPSQVYRWASEVRTTHRDDLFKVLQQFAVRDGREVSIINTTTKPPLVIKVTDKEENIDSGSITSLCFSDDCQTLASGHKNGWIKLWRREEDQWEVFKRFKGGDDGIWLPAFSRDGSRFVLKISDDGPNKLWSLSDDSLIELEDSKNARSLAWSPSGDWVVAGTVDGAVKIWSPDQGKIEHTFKAHDDAIVCLAFRHDGRVLATGSNGGEIRIWRCHTWEKILPH